MNESQLIELERKDMKFKGKVSWWFYAIMISVAVILIPIIIMSLLDTDIIVFLINFIVLLALELFCIAIVFHNYIELQNESLLIVFGLTKVKISYSDIIALTPTHNPLSSLAASFDRIEIQCRKKTCLMIAVIDKDTFLDEMKRRNPHIIIY